MKHTRRLALVATLVVICGAVPGAQSNTRRLTTVGALRQFPGYFHLQNVLVHGELAESGQRIALRANDTEIRVRLESSVTPSSGPVEVRGQLIDIGRLESGDPRAGNFAEGRESTSWPRPGEELVLQVSGVRASEPMVTAEAVTLLSSPTVIWLSRKTSLMKLTSCALEASMGIPTSAGFHTGQVSPCSSGRPFGLLGPNCWGKT